LSLLSEDVQFFSIKEHPKVIGADAHKKDSGEGGHGHHHSVSHSLVATIEGNTVRLSANADITVTFD